jgi:drug/metabolite transporter (DMT)-like permease
VAQGAGRRARRRSAGGARAARRASLRLSRPTPDAPRAAGDRWRALAALLAATAIWGSTFVVVQRAIRDLPVLHLLALRFWLGALLLAPLALRRRRPPLRDALLVGGALFVGFVLQTYGLRSTTPSRSAFLTGLAVVFVPALAWVFQGRSPRRGPLVGAALAAAGLWILYRPTAGGLAFGAGDWLTLGCALVFAAHLLFVESALRRSSAAALALAQVLVVALLASPSLFVRPMARAAFTPAALAAILLTGVFATALAFLALLYAQRRLSAAETAVVLALEPVFAAAVSVGLGAESVSPPLLAGGALLVVALVVAQLGADEAGAEPVGP